METKKISEDDEKNGSNTVTVTFPLAGLVAVITGILGLGVGGFVPSFDNAALESALAKAEAASRETARAHAELDVMKTEIAENRRLIITNTYDTDAVGKLRMLQLEKAIEKLQNDKIAE
jgi:hypothetical protein